MKMILIVFALLGVVSTGLTLGQMITLPLTGGSNTDPVMVANPRVNMTSFSSQTSLVKAMADIHDRFGTYLFNRSAAIGCEPAALAAIIYVESGGHGFSGSRMIIRFENHVFRPRLNNDSLFYDHFTYNADQAWTGQKWRRLTTDPFTAFHGNQDLEWTVLQFAQGLNDLAALNSASYGAPQIMGFNAQSIGYTNAREMFLAFSNSLENQMDGMVAFIQGRSACLSGLRNNDFVQFASCYNGAGQATAYGNNILNSRNAYDRVLKILNITVPSPAPACSYEDITGSCLQTCSDNSYAYTDVECAAGTSCCIESAACSPSAGVNGRCLDTAVCSGATFSGLCPGSVNIKCCVSAGSYAPSASQPTSKPPTSPISAPTLASKTPTATPSLPLTALPTSRSPTVTPTRLPTSKSPTLIPSALPTSKRPTLTPTLQPISKSPTLTPTAISCTIDGGFNQGECKDTSLCTGPNSPFPGFCPGASNIQCCVATPLRTRSPTFLQTSSPTSTCSYEGLGGYCSATPTCRDSANSRGYSLATPSSPLCAFCCVAAQTCSSGGRCLDTSVCSIGSKVLGGLCPGSAKIKCCVPISSELGADSASTNNDVTSTEAMAAGVAVPIVALAAAGTVLLLRRKKRIGAERRADDSSRWSVINHPQMSGLQGSNPLFHQSTSSSAPPPGTHV